MLLAPKRRRYKILCEVTASCPFTLQLFFTFSETSAALYSAFIMACTKMPRFQRQMLFLTGMPRISVSVKDYGTLLRSYTAPSRPYSDILHMCCIIVTQWGEPVGIEAKFLRASFQCFDTVGCVIWPVNFWIQLCILLCRCVRSVCQPHQPAFSSPNTMK